MSKRTLKTGLTVGLIVLGILSWATGLSPAGDLPEGSDHRVSLGRLDLEDEIANGPYIDPTGGAAVLS